MIHNGGRYPLVIAKVGRKSTQANPLGEKVIHLKEVPSVTPPFTPKVLYYLTLQPFYFCPHSAPLLPLGDKNA